MLTVTIICVGKLKEHYLRDACGEYIKRLGAYCKLNIIETEEHRLPDNPSQAQIKQALANEGAAVLSKLPERGALVIPLCVEGEAKSSGELAEIIKNAPLRGKNNIVFIIGGSHGLTGGVKKAGDLCLSISAMTFPHQLARVMLLEQIYRAFGINSGGKYHK